MSKKNRMLMRSVQIKIYINSGEAQAKQFFRKNKHYIFAVKLIGVKTKMNLISCLKLENVKVNFFNR